MNYIKTKKGIYDIEARAYYLFDGSVKRVDYCIDYEEDPSSCVVADTMEERISGGESMKPATRIRLDQAEVMELSKLFHPLNEVEQKKFFNMLIREALTSSGVKRETLMHIIRWSIKSEE